MSSLGNEGNGFSAMSSSTMRGTSSYSNAGSATIGNSTTIRHYSTAPMRMANGSIQTAASTLIGGILADETGFTSASGSTGFIPTDPQRSIAPPQFAPLHLDWDALLLILLMVWLYALRLHRQSPTTQP